MQPSQSCKVAEAGFKLRPVWLLSQISQPLLPQFQETKLLLSEQKFLSFTIIFDFFYLVHIPWLTYSAWNSVKHHIVPHHIVQIFALE